MGFLNLRNASKGASTASSGIKGWFKLGLMFLFFLYLAIHAVMLSVETGSIETGLLELGKEMIKPFEAAAEHSDKILQSESNGIFASLWDVYGLFFEIFKIYLWIRVFIFVFNLVLGNTNPPIVIYGLALFFFIIVQISYFIITGLGADYIIEVSMKIFDAITFSIKSIIEAFTFSGTPDAKFNCSDSVCTL